MSRTLILFFSSGPEKIRHLSLSWEKVLLLCFVFLCCSFQAQIRVWDLLACHLARKSFRLLQPQEKDVQVSPLRERWVFPSGAGIAHFLLMNSRVRLWTWGVDGGGRCLRSINKDLPISWKAGSLSIFSWGHPESGHHAWDVTLDNH